MKDLKKWSVWMYNSIASQCRTLLCFSHSWNATLCSYSVDCHVLDYYRKIQMYPGVTHVECIGEVPVVAADKQGTGSQA